MAWPTRVNSIPFTANEYSGGPVPLGGNSEVVPGSDGLEPCLSRADRPAPTRIS